MSQPDPQTDRPRPGKPMSGAGDDRWTGLYEELREFAHRYLSGQRPDDTMQPTALVHEAYLRLTQTARGKAADRRQLYHTAAKAMRSVVVDHARYRRAHKRGGGANRVSLDQVVAWYDQNALDIIALDEALERLTARDPDLTRVVELRFFGGLTESETGHLLNMSPRSVRRHWRIAKRWLYHELGGTSRDDR